MRNGRENGIGGPLLIVPHHSQSMICSPVAQPPGLRATSATGRWLISRPHRELDRELKIVPGASLTVTLRDRLSAAARGAHPRVPWRAAPASTRKRDSDR